MPAPDVSRRRLAAAALALAVVAALLTLLPAPGAPAAAGPSVTAGSGQDAVTARRAVSRPPLPALLVVAAFAIALPAARRPRPVRVSRPGQRRHVDVWIPERAPPATS